MTSELDVDRVLEDWLAEGPSRLPDRVISETVENLDHIKQRRYLLPQGRERMTRLLIAGTGLAAALIAAAVGFATLTGGDGVGGPDGVTHTSERHGYSVFLPDGWTIEERPGTWEPGEFVDANSEDGVDYFELLDPALGPPLYVYVASQPIGAGTTFEAWAARHDEANRLTAPCFVLVGDYETTIVDGETARTGLQRCEDFEAGGDGAWMTIQTLVAHEGQGYVVYMWPVQTGSAMPPVADLRREAADWLSRFSFTD